jgi:hypothetical protein
MLHVQAIQESFHHHSKEGSSLVHESTGWKKSSAGWKVKRRLAPAWRMKATGPRDGIGCGCLHSSVDGSGSMEEARAEERSVITQKKAMGAAMTIVVDLNSVLS